MARDIKGQQFAAVRTKIHEVLQCLRPLGSHSPSWKRWNRSQAQSFGKAGQLLDPHGCTAKCVKSRDVEKVKGWKVAQAGSLSGLGALESCSCTGRPEHSYEATQSCSNEFVAWGWRLFCGPSRETQGVKRQLALTNHLILFSYSLFCCRRIPRPVAFSTSWGLR